MVQINLATKEELIAALVATGLISEKTAIRIGELRDSGKVFRSFRDLTEVKGIGNSLARQLAPRIDFRSGGVSLPSSGVNLAFAPHGANDLASGWLAGIRSVFAAIDPQEAQLFIHEAGFCGRLAPVATLHYLMTQAEPEMGLAPGESVEALLGGTETPEMLQSLTRYFEDGCDQSSGYFDGSAGVIAFVPPVIGKYLQRQAEERSHLVMELEKVAFGSWLELLRAHFSIDAALQTLSVGRRNEALRYCWLVVASLARAFRLRDAALAKRIQQASQDGCAVGVIRGGAHQSSLAQELDELAVPFKVVAQMPPDLPEFYPMLMQRAGFPGLDTEEGRHLAMSYAFGVVGLPTVATMPGFESLSRIVASEGEVDLLISRTAAKSTPADTSRWFETIPSSAEGYRQFQLASAELYRKLF